MVRGLRILMPHMKAHLRAWRALRPSPNTGTRSHNPLKRFRNQCREMSGHGIWKETNDKLQQIANIDLNPDCELWLTWMTTTSNPTKITRDWKTSVQITAFMPPWIENLTFQTCYFSIDAPQTLRNYTDWLENKPPTKRPLTTVV